MPKKVSITYYFSDLFPVMGFDSEKDAGQLDIEVDKYLDNENCILDFIAACRNYPSDYAIKSSIEYNPHIFCGSLTDVFIFLCKNRMISNYDGSAIYADSNFVYRDLVASPWAIANGFVREDCEFICWYNK